jgi:hypothetical protein
MITLAPWVRVPLPSSSDPAAQSARAPAEPEGWLVRPGIGSLSCAVAPAFPERCRPQILQKRIGVSLAQRRVSVLPSVPRRGNAVGFK